MKKLASMTVACLLALTLLCQQTPAASATADKEARLASKVKTGIMKLGVGPETRVDVKLKDKTRLSGYVSEISDGSFAVTDLKSGEVRTISYPDVVQVKGNNL